jgi:hypothetical protein
LNAIDPVRILSYGAVGLGFLLAFLAYRLLAKEQAGARPRPTMIRAIYSFMGFSFLLCLLGFVGEFLKTKTQESSITTPNQILAGSAIEFSLYQMYSSALINRTKKGLAPDWDERCKNLASSTLVEMGFSLLPVESSNATRGEFEHAHLGVQCFSEYDHALIYGVAAKKDSFKLKALSEALETRMKYKWSELK